MRIDVTFVGVGLLFLIFGMVFGMWMGAREDFQLADAHAHFNLLGFVVPAIYGLVHRAYPSLARSRLAWPQCIAHFVGVIIFVPGIVVSILESNQLLVIAGSTILTLATVTFGFIFVAADKAK
jgi:hypothetical protein